MSNKYKNGDFIPTYVLTKRIDELVKAITNEGVDYVKRLLSELTMRIPAELDRDADLVLSECAKRLTEYEHEISNLRIMKNETIEFLEDGMGGGEEGSRLRAFLDKLKSAHLPGRGEVKPTKVYTIQKDGDEWFATNEEFIDLQQSIAGFGKTIQEAVLQLQLKEESQKQEGKS